MRIVSCLIALLALAGCKSVPVEKDVPPAIVLVQDSQGNVVLNWKSQPGCIYRILYRDDPLKPFIKLPSTMNGIAGTGGSLNAYDKVEPGAKQHREYRIQAQMTK